MSEAAYVESAMVRQLRGVCEEYRHREFGFGALNFVSMARDCANEIERLERENAALRAQEQNEPLTLEQAIIRIGDAVWLRLKIPGEYDGWRFLIGESGPYFVFTLASGRKEMYLKETIGSDYNLYAHEPKGADHE